MEVLKSISNQIKHLELQRRKRSFNSPGEGGNVAYVLKTKYGEPVLVFHNEDKKGPILNYYLESVHFGKIKKSAMILFLKEESLFISDIQVLEIKKVPFIKKYRKGYGSVFMKFILSEAERHKYILITGKMTFEDEDHKKRQMGFYRKHGFDIGENYMLSKEL